MRFRAVTAIAAIAASITTSAVAGDGTRLPDVYPTIGADVMAPTLSDIEQRAKIVARVRLTGRTRVNFQPVAESSRTRPLGEGSYCGYLYEATVVDSIKGNDNSFAFFSSDEADFSGYDHDYLVFIFERDKNWKPFSLSDTKYAIPEKESRKLNCLLSQPYYVGANIQTMFSFVKNDDSSERLQDANRFAPGSCWLFRKNINRWSLLRAVLIGFRKENSYSPC